MTMTRPHFTLRRLMAAVAIVGMLLGTVVWMVRRAARFRAEADRHREAWLMNIDRYVHSTSPLSSYHQEIEAKYRRASRCPRLPVSPNPPEPE
jgi:hypothetical protein